MICLMLSQVLLSVTGSCAIAFQKLLIQSVFRVAMMSSYTARTSGLAWSYSMNPNVDIPNPQNDFLPYVLRTETHTKMLHQEGNEARCQEHQSPRRIDVEPRLAKNRQPHLAV